MILNDSVQDNYLNILEQLEQEPGSEQALNSLIELESNIKEAVFDILENYKKQWIDVDNTKINEAIHGRIFELRNKLEARIMQMLTNDKVSLTDLLDNYIVRINEILENNENIEDIVKQMKIEFYKIEDTILPPDEQEVNKWNGGWGFEKREWYNKFGDDRANFEQRHTSYS